MRAIPVARVEERREALRIERKKLRRRDRAIAAELRILETLEVQAVEVAPASATKISAFAGGSYSRDTTVRPAAEVDAVVTTGQPFFRRPATEGSPVSKVQLRVWDLVTTEPGVQRVDAIRRVAELVNTSVDSARESVRRMVKAGKLTLDEGDRLFPMASDSAPPLDDDDMESSETAKAADAEALPPSSPDVAP